MLLFSSLPPVNWFCFDDNSRPAGKQETSGANCANGAQGRDRTTDTAIFSRMLYQLSYLGTSLTAGGLGAPVYSQAGQPCPPRFAFGFARRSLAR